MTVSLIPEAERTAKRLATAATEKRRRREEAADEAERTRVPGHIKPTRQTAARLQPDPIERLHTPDKDGKRVLTDAQRDAALDIRLAYYETVHRVMARSQRFDGGRGGTFVDSVERETAAQIDRRQRYRRWADSARMQMAGAFMIAIEVAVEGRSPAQLDREGRWKHGRARDLLVDALSHYAVLAGWETREKAA